MVTIFYRNRQILLLAVTLIIVIGLHSFFMLPRLEDPEIKQRAATITTIFPGATAERVEALVTDPIEQELSDIEEIDTLESVSGEGISIIIVNLKETVNDIAQVWARVRTEIDDVRSQLPEGALDPRYQGRKIKANALIVGLTWELDTPVNHAVLRRLAKRLEDRLRYLDGSDQVEIYGDPKEEILVEIRPADLARLGLTVQEVSQQIFASDAKVSAGQLRGRNNEFSLEISGELDSLERVRNIPIRTDNTGQITRLGDIGMVSKGIASPVNSLAIVSKKAAIVVSAQVESKKRINDWAKKAHEVLAEFKSELPQEVGLKIILDQNFYVQQRINGVISGELFVGSLLAMICVLFVMGWRSAIVVTIALPLASMLVFGAMAVLEIPLHQVSIIGLVVAIGLLIDSAICMADEVQHRLHEGMNPEAAIKDAAKQMIFPLGSSTITTILAFLPIALCPGSAGEFTSALGINCILGLCASLLIAFTILPAQLVLLHNWGHKLKLPRWLQEGFSHPLLTKVYRQTLAGAFQRPMMTVAFCLVVPIIGFAVAFHIPQQFFSSSGRDQFFIDFELPNQATIEETREQVVRATDLILKHSEILDVHWFLGQSAPPFYYNLVGTRENAPDYAQGLVQLKPNIPSLPIIQKLQKELDAEFLSAQILVRQIEHGSPFNAPIEMRLYGSDLEQLRKLGDKARLILAEMPNIIHSRASLTEGVPKLAVNVDEEKSRIVGLDKTSIARQLDTALEGARGGSILEDTEELPVRVRLSDFNRSNLDRIMTLDLLPNHLDRNNNQTIPFSTVGEISLKPDIAVINRRNGQRVNVIHGFLKAGALPAEAFANFQQLLKEKNFQLPPGYSYDFGGEWQERTKAQALVFSNVPIVTVFIAATLVLTFNSFTLATAVGTIAILSVGLGFVALYLSGYPFGYIGIIGTIALIGIAINESTVVLSALLTDEQASVGDRKAVEEVVVHSSRHLFATTITDTAGFVPLMLDPTGFWNPLAFVIGGGLIGVTFLSIYFVPAVYLLVKRRKSTVKKLCVKGTKPELVQ
jgi:multidrug efflux pump subunit AcrB